jgi:hypothetical protein
MTIQQFILSKTYAFQSKVNGGHWNKLSPQEAMAVAIGVAKAHDAWDTEVAIQLALMEGESCFDCNAIDPNLCKAPGAKFVDGVCVMPGVWPDAATQAKNTDYGLCQVNGNSTYLGPNAIGMSLEFMCRKINKTMLYFMARKYPLEVAFLGYNEGTQGAKDTFDALLNQYNGDEAKALADSKLGYGRNVYKRYQECIALGVV